MASFGELHTAVVYFKGNEGEYKRRPVLIIDDSEEDLITIVEITSEKPKEPPGYYDTFKVEIIEWKNAGLKKRSWAKCHRRNIHRVSKDRVIQFIGVIDETDLIRILEKITDQ